MKPNSIKVYRKVAHTQLSDSSAEKRYEELCKSIPEHGHQCLQHANSLMAEMWVMAEEVHELKGVCKALGKAYEAEAIKLCRGETAFHYLRDLYTAFSGDRQRALACAKAPYTLLREFRAERAAKNREKKCQADEPTRLKGLDSIPVDGCQKMPDTGTEQTLPPVKSSAEIITMQPEIIDVVVEPPASISTVGQPLMVDDDTHLDRCSATNVDEQYNDATEKAKAFIKCSLFEGDVHKALEFLKMHFLEKPSDDNPVASPKGNGRVKHSTATENAGTRRAKLARTLFAHKKKTAAKKRGVTNPANTSWPPPIVCGEVSTWEEAKKGQYVTWGAVRVMVIDDIQDSAIILEDPFYPTGKYPIRVTRKTWSHVQRTTEDRVTSEFVRVCGKVPASAKSSSIPILQSPASKAAG